MFHANIISLEEILMSNHPIVDVLIFLPWLNYATFLYRVP